MARRAAALAAVAAAALVAFATGATGAAFSGVTDSAGNSLLVDTLDAPSGLAAGGTTTVQLSWTATADEYATGHRVYRATAPGGPYTEIATVTPRTTTTYEDDPGTGTFHYVVRAEYMTWRSAASNEVSATR